MALKAQWVNSLELGGVMVWSIEADDWRGDYGEAYPLANTLKRIMNRCSSLPLSLETFWLRQELSKCKY